MSLMDGKIGAELAASGLDDVDCAGNGLGIIQYVTAYRSILALGAVAVRVFDKLYIIGLLVIGQGQAIGVKDCSPRSGLRIVRLELLTESS